MTLPAITIREPWVSAVAAGVKTVENRGRKTNHRGLIAVHRGKEPDRYGYTDPRILAVFDGLPPKGLPGAVVAVADLVDCHLAGPCVNLLCHPWGDRYYDGEPAWHLTFANVRRLTVPVPARGQQSVGWHLPPDVEAQVRAQLAEQVAG